MVNLRVLLVLFSCVHVGLTKRKTHKIAVGKPLETPLQASPETTTWKTPDETTTPTTTQSQTTEQLLDGLRQKQIQGMVEEQDRILALHVPDELARAAFNEAERRKLQAESDVFEMNKTPYSPFDAEKSPKNIGYLGRGYDILFGNPLDETGRVDPGFRLPAIRLDYLMNVFTSDGEYRMPDNSDVIMEPSALFTSSYSDVRTESDYKEELSKEVKKTAGFGVEGGGVSVSGEFTQSKSYQNTKESIKKGGKVNIDIIGRATVYKAVLNTFGNYIKASTLLQSAIGSLPVPTTGCPSAEMSPYYKLIQNFGTHFATVVTMGAKAVQRLTMTTAESMELKKNSITTSQVVSASFGFKAKGVGANVNYGNEESSNHDTHVSETLQTMNIKRTEFYIGGEPPSESSGEGDQGDTQSLLEWGKSAREHPVPIQYELQKIQDLFSKTHLPDISDTEDQITAKKRCLTKALERHCSRVAVDIEDCVAYEDGTGNNDVIRYGDFIALQTAAVHTDANAKYLTAPKKPPKFGVGDETKQMKVVPVDATAYWKYGQALHYGESFNLVTEYGGEQAVVRCTTSQSTHRYDLVNFGKEVITCGTGDVAAGEWTHHEYKRCQGTSPSSTPLSEDPMGVHECKVLCLQRTDGACKAIQYDYAFQLCYECKDPTQLVELGPGENFDVYTRVSTAAVPQKPFTVAILYFTSPLGKKQGTLVTKDDKVHIGISYYDANKALYDVQRPAFLKLMQTDDRVEVVADDGAAVTGASPYNDCTQAIERPKVSHAKECKYWWKIQANKKTLRTYPTVHFDTSPTK